MLHLISDGGAVRGTEDSFVCACQLQVVVRDVTGQHQHGLHTETKRLIVWTAETVFLQENCFCLLILLGPVLELIILLQFFLYE